ncbi:tetratricopeptide repeat-containing protein [Azotobacter sp. CWF10]
MSGKGTERPQGNCPIRVIEQLANFRVRHAAEEWLKSRRQDVGEIDSATCKKEIERAISDLKMLCRHAPTAERFSLLGSAYKRLALMQEPTPARLDTLDKMAAAYEQSFKRGGCGEAYAFSNWAIAELLALRLDTARAGDWQSTLESECSRLYGRLQADNEHNPNFWNSAGPVDLGLVRLLALYAPAIETLPMEREALVERIIDGYRNAIERGASPRECASVFENLEWMIALFASNSDPLTNKLVQIRDFVQMLKSVA